MPAFLNITDTDFQTRFATLCDCKQETNATLKTDVAKIIQDVQTRGDDALYDLTQKHDQLDCRATGFAIPADTIARHIATIPPDQRNALELAATRIRTYHETQRPTDAWWQDDTGAHLGWRWSAIDRAGLYVPGGQAAYPSSVLMNAIPAKVAGVSHLIMCVPTPNGVVSPLVLLAAQLAGIDTIYTLGGAQAIAAMAFGTQSIDKVDMIAGPGNAYVAAAKAQVFGTVGIDMIAGPSEVLIVADKDNNPDWVAMDLLSQAEHDADAQAILITDNADFAGAVARAVDAHLPTLERGDIAAQSWRDNGAIITVETLAQAVDLSDKIAPEHLQVCTKDALDYSAQFRHAGAIFIGGWSPEAIGDYIGGPNHVLPTAGSARFVSGLSVLNFMKRTSLSMMTPVAISAIGGAGETLARAEGLQAHAESIAMRLKALNDES